MAKKKSTKKTGPGAATKKKAAKQAPRAAPAPPPPATGERRFELVEGSSAKFWIIKRVGDTLVTRYGRLGSPGEFTDKLYDDEVQAAKTCEKLIQQKLGKGYHEVTLPQPASPADARRLREAHEPFLQAILADPDDAASYGAYGDWLAKRGDPRGEFILVQLALEDERRTPAQRKDLQQREQRLLAEHQAKWLGGYAELLLLKNHPVHEPGYGARRPNFCYRFERGFLAHLDVCQLYVPVARTIRDADETRFLRELVIESAAHLDAHFDDFPEERDATAKSPFEFDWGPDLPRNSERAAYIGLVPLNGVKQFPALRRFQIGLARDMPPGRYPGDCHTHFETAVELAEKMPRLEQLRLLCKSFDIERLFASDKFPGLTLLQIHHLGASRGSRSRRRNQYEYPLEILAKNKAFANLEQLLLHPRVPEYNPNDRDNLLPSFVPLAKVKALVNSKVLKKLHTLQIRLSDMGDEGCRVIVDSGILQQLKHLDLRHGCITDAGAAILAACPDFKRLKSLDLARNALTNKGIRLLKSTGVVVHARAQLTDRQLEEREFMYDGDGE